MEPVYLFTLASRHAAWASFRQTVITGNIANANTPGYAARDVEPFASVLGKAGVAMAQTASGHIGAGATEAEVGKTILADPWSVNQSGNSVSLDQELMKAAEVNRAISLDVTIARSFNRMLLASVRSGA